MAHDWRYAYAAGFSLFVSGFSLRSLLDAETPWKAGILTAATIICAGMAVMQFHCARVASKEPRS